MSHETEGDARSEHERKLARAVTLATELIPRLDELRIAWMVARPDVPHRMGIFLSEGWAMDIVFKATSDVFDTAMTPSGGMRPPGDAEYVPQPK